MGNVDNLRDVYTHIDYIINIQQINIFIKLYHIYSAKKFKNKLNWKQ